MSNFMEGLVGLGLYLAGIFVGVILVVTGASFTKGLEAEALIEYCEMTLPRDEVCVLEAAVQGIEGVRVVREVPLPPNFCQTGEW